jgi:20S proteasome alpha/beta subunit
MIPERISKKYQRYPWRPAKEQRRDMTLIVGFPTPQGVVLGADGEEGTALHKSAVRKIEAINGPGYKCAVAGAGDSNFIDLAVQEAREAIAELSPPNLTDIRTTSEHVVTEIYTERIDRLPPEQAANAQFELLCAAWAEKERHPQLIRVGRGYSLIRMRPDILGTGTYLASYLIDTLVPNRVEPHHITRRQAERLAVYIIAKAKAHVQGVGGATQVVVVTNEGTSELMPKAVIDEDEFAGDHVIESVRLLFNWMDILGVNGKIEEIDRVADDVVRLIKQGFHQRYDQLVDRLNRLAKSPVPPPPKDDPKAPPPSPE